MGVARVGVDSLLVGGQGGEFALSLGVLLSVFTSGVGARVLVGEFSPFPQSLGWKRSRSSNT